jgi:hypothetical protein
LEPKHFIFLDSQYFKDDNEEKSNWIAKKNALTVRINTFTDIDVTEIEHQFTDKERERRIDEIKGKFKISDKMFIEKKNGLSPVFDYLFG